MKNHRIRGFLSSIFRDHFDSDNPEWLEEHRKEIENNVKKILELINEEKEGSPNEGEELASLIEDFYKHYQILHDRYDRLAGDIKKNVNGSEKTDVSSSSSSSSDSDSEKSKSRNVKGRSHKKSASGYKDLQTQNENLKHQLEASYVVENDMKQRLMSITEERDNLMSQNVNALDRIKEADKKIEEFLLASEHLNRDRAQLEIEKSELKLQLETERNEMVDLKHRLEASIKERDALSSEILAALSKAEGAEKSIEDLRSEVNVLREESSSLLSKIEVFKQENSVNMGNLQQAHKTIEDYITEMEKLKTEISVLRSEKEDVNKEIGNLNEILAATHTEKDILSTQHMSVSEKLEAAERQIEELNKETEILKLGLSERDKINGDMKKEVEGAYREFDNLKQVLQLAEEDKNKLILENSEASNKLQQTEKNLQELQQRHNALNEISAATYAEKDILSAQHRSISEKLEAAETQIEVLNKETQILKLDLSDRDKINGDMKKEVEGAYREFDNLKQVLQLAEEDKNKLILENSETSNKLQQTEKNLQELQQSHNALNEISAATYAEKDILSAQHRSISEKLEAAERQIEVLNKETQILKLDLSERDKINGDMKKEVEGAYREFESLKQVLQLAEEEKNKLTLENSEALNKLQQTEKDLQELQQSHNALHSQILDLEKSLQDKEEQIPDLLKNFEAQKNEAFGQIDALKLQINELESQNGSLSTLKTELEEQIEILKNDALVKQKQIEDIKEDSEDKIRNLERKYEGRGEELSNLTKMLEGVKSEASLQIDDLQSVVSLLRSQKKESEEQMEIMEKDLSSKILELEKVLVEKEEMNRLLAENHRQLEVEFHKSCDELQKAESQIRDVEEGHQMLSLQVNDRTLEVASLVSLKGEMEEQLGKAKWELSELELEKEKLYQELQSKISDQERILQERDGTLDELKMKCKQLEDRVFDLCEKLKFAEQKIEESKEERQRVEESKDIVIQNMQISIEGMKRDIETAEEEISRLKDDIVRHDENYKLLQISAKDEKAELSNKMEEQIEILKNDTLVKQKQIEDIKEDSEDKIRNLEQKYEGRVEELSNLTKMLEGAKSEASHQIDDLQSECSLLRSQKRESEEQMQIMEKDLSSKILELEKVLEEKEEMNRLLAENHRHLEVEFHKSCDELQMAESKIRDVEEGHQMLSLQVNDRTLEVASLVSLKGEIEEQLGKAKGELSDLEMQKEKLYQELQSKISDQERILQERDGTLDELKMKCKQLEDQVFDLCEKLKIAEQKIEELEEERQRVEESKDIVIQNMQISIEWMKRDIETAEEEISRLKGDIVRHDENYKLLQISAEDEKIELTNKMADPCQVNDDQKEEIAKLQVSVQNAEVQLRLSTRKLQITESEFEKKEEMYHSKEEEMHEKHKLIEVQVLTSSEKINILENEKKETFGKMVTGMKSLNFGFDNLLSKVDENYCRMDTRLSEFSTELQTMRQSVSDMINQKHMLKGEIHDLTERLKDTGISKSVLEKKLGVLETTMGETMREKNKLAGTVAEFLKKMGEAELKVQKKEVEMEEKNEEKREAIRQLCIYIEYYRENHDLLKESLLKMLSRTRRR